MLAACLLPATEPPGHPECQGGDLGHRMGTQDTRMDATDRSVPGAFKVGVEETESK